MFWTMLLFSFFPEIEEVAEGGEAGVMVGGEGDTEMGSSVSRERTAREQVASMPKPLTERGSTRDSERIVRTQWQIADQMFCVDCSYVCELYVRQNDSS